MLETKCISNGIVAGAVAGIVVAFFIILGGMAEPLGSLIGIPNKLGGLIAHFIISILVGVIFALILGWLVRSWWSAIFLGLLFGIVTWIAGPLTFLPSLAAGVPLFSQWNPAGINANVSPLIGHLIFGLALGLSYCFLKKGKLHRLKKHTT